jgi:hypothetical protein
MDIQQLLEWFLRIIKFLSDDCSTPANQLRDEALKHRDAIREHFNHVRPKKKVKD